MQYPISIGEQLISNSDIPRHMIPNSYTPKCSNLILTKEMVRKRPGIGLVYQWDTGDVLRGAFIVDSTHAIIALYDYSATQTILIEWNRDVNTPVFTTIATGFDSDANWHFFRHFDSTISGTNNAGVIIGINNVDSPIYYDPSSVTPIVTLTNSYTAKYGCSFQGAAYFGNVTEDPTGAPAALPYRVQKSTTDDASDWTNEEFETRPENSSEITGLIPFKGAIYVCKTDMVCPMVPYLAFTTPLFEKDIGLTSEYGYIAAVDSIYLNSNNRIINLQGEHASYKIHNLFAGHAAGATVTAVNDPYLDRHLWAARNYMFLKERSKDNWTMWEFGADIRLLANIDPYDRDVTQLYGSIEKHTLMTVDEEQITPDFLVAYNDNTLAVMNHYCEDIGGTPITCSYYTPMLSLDNPYKRKYVRGLKMQGEPGRVLDVYLATNDWPGRTEPAYTRQSIRLEFDSYGFGYIPLDDTGAHVGIGWEESSINPVNVTTMLLDFDEAEPLC